MSDKKHYFVPTNLNKEPFLSIWRMVEEKPSICFIQISEDEQNPHWVKWGDILEGLTKHSSNFDETILKDIIEALRCHESLPSTFFKKYL